MLQKLTKPSIFIYLIYAVVLFVMSLIFATDLQSIMTQDNSVPAVIKDTRTAIQNANNMVFYLFVVGIIGVILLFIFGNSYRKKLYLSNLIAGVVIPVVVIIMVIVTALSVSSAISTYYTNLDGIKEYFLVYLFGSVQPIETLIYPTIALVLVIGFGVISLLYAIYTVCKYLKTKPSRKVVEADAK